MRLPDSFKGAGATLGAALAAMAFVASCTQPPVASDGATEAIETAFVVLGVDGQAVARVVTRARECPVLMVDDAAQPMTVRAAAASVPVRPIRGGADGSKPSEFPVLVCDAQIDARAIRASVGGRSLPLLKPDPRRIVVLGDSGCRLKRLEGTFQFCNDREAWPFPDVADAAAALHPDLVIHVGDYLYRENPCPAGNAGCAGSPWGYGWDAWNADFFSPARRLLAAAPWIVVRGNHESCDRAGQGWWRFVDPRPPAAARDCNDPANDATGDFSDPYAVQIGRDTQFIVFDSSKAGVDPLNAADPLYGVYSVQMAKSFALARRHRGRHSVFLNHQPILAFTPDPSIQPAGVSPGNRSLQSVLRPLNGDALFPSDIEALLSGHVHLFEMVSYSTDQPTQLVAGNGGAWANVSLPQSLPPGATPSAGATVQSIVSTNRPGFLMLEREADGRWRIEARDRRGDLLTLCTLAGRKARCTPEILP